MIEIVGNPKYRRVYISGPITGIVNGNREKFEEYSQKFRNLNFEVVNPHNLFSKEEVDELNRQLDAGEISKEEHWAVFMKRDLPEMLKCSIIAVMPKWEGSKGCNVEVYVARNLYMPIIDATNLQELF